MDSTTIIEAFKPAPSPSDETSLEGATIYQFGQRVDVADFLTIPYNVQYQAIDDITKSYQTFVKGNDPIDKITIRYRPTNGLGIYFMNGKATEEIADQKQTVTTWDIGTRKPCMTVVQKVGSLHPFVVYGVIITDAIYSYKQKEGWVFQLEGVGRKHEVTDITLETPIMPTGPTNTNENDIFNVCNYVKWGADGNEEAFGFLDSIEIRQGHSVIKSMGDNGYYVDVSEGQGILTTVSYQCYSLEGVNDSVFADAHAKTQRSFTLKGSKSSNSNHWFTLDLDLDSAVHTQLDVIHENGKVVGWGGTIVGGQPTWTIQDYLSSTLYTVPEE